MSNNYIPTLDPTQIDAIVHANFNDIFAVLGMHPNPSDKGLIVRCFLPGALSVTVMARSNNAKVASLSQIDSAGLFEGLMGRRVKRFDYYLKVNYPQLTTNVEDAYQYPSVLAPEDLYLFGEGTHEQAYRWLGAQLREVNGISGTVFSVWAPNASRVSVVGDFNHWDGRCNVMREHPDSGIWEIFIPGLVESVSYKYEIRNASGEVLPQKADPFALAMQGSPDTASVSVPNTSYSWTDAAWMARHEGPAQPHEDAVSIYEVYLGSWRRNSGESHDYLSYSQLAEQLIPYVLEMGFTHLQLMPISEFPFDGSWGYQPIGLYAPTSRFGRPEEFKYFIDQCHAHNLGVLLDWVPGHFPSDEHGLGKFDGSHLYEHADLQKGFHPDWNTLIYNYGRAEVVSFLLSNALFWLEEYHIDGLRVDAVASMLYLDYSRKDGEWSANEHGGRENLEAIELLKTVTSRAYFKHPNTMMIAEESTAWPGVSRPVDQGGLGFGFKWNMGWMNDTLRYMERDPVHRQHHHHEMTFGLVYAFSENFVLPLSHDEVVHGKGSLIDKMPGDEWQKFANLRAYFGFMWGHPGKKLLFMGSEFAQRQEWNHDQSLDWHLLEQPEHAGIQQLVKDLNALYRQQPALYQQDCSAQGFEWLDDDNSEQSIFAFLRKGNLDSPPVLVVSNMTPTPHYNYQLGVPEKGFYREALNTDSSQYGGSNIGNQGGVSTIEQAGHGHAYQLNLTLPPLSTVIFVKQ